MIAEPGVLSTSPWHHDILTTRDLFRNTQLSELDTDLDNFDIDKTKKFDSWSSTPSDVSCGTSRGTSVASSECSDELCIDIEGEVAESVNLFGFTPEPNPFLDDFIGLDNTGPDLSAFGWSDSELECSVSSFAGTVDLNDDDDQDDAHSDILPSLPCSAQVKKRGRSKTSACRKAWGRMCSQEKMETIEDLTTCISNELGLREQLDVIRILNPNATVLPTDTEFVIDLDCLSDEKLREVWDYLRHHRPTQSRKKTTERAHSVGSCGSRSGSSSSSSSNFTCTNSCTDSNSVLEKKQTKKQRRQQQCQERQRQRRENRQIMKEKRSGLFRQEEVMALSVIDTEEAVDIDILT